MVLAGMVLFFAGLLALGIFVAAAGEDAFGLAIGLGIAMVVFFATGITLLILANRRRGGLLDENLTARDVETYREDYRG